MKIGGARAHQVSLTATSLIPKGKRGSVWAKEKTQHLSSSNRPFYREIDVYRRLHLDLDVSGTLVKQASKENGGLN